LKGADLRKAARQILATFMKLKVKGPKVIFNGHAVLSRTPRPDIKSTEVVTLERELAKTGGGFRKESILMNEFV
jgi:ribosomal protein S3